MASAHIKGDRAHINCDQLEIIRLLLTLTANKSGSEKRSFIAVSMPASFARCCTMAQASVRDIPRIAERLRFADRGDFSLSRCGYQRPG